MAVGLDKLSQAVRTGYFGDALTGVANAIEALTTDEQHAVFKELARVLDNRPLPLHGPDVPSSMQESIGCDVSSCTSCRPSLTWYPGLVAQF